MIWIETKCVWEEIGLRWNGMKFNEREERKLRNGMIGNECQVSLREL